MVKCNQDGLRAFALGKSRNRKPSSHGHTCYAINIETWLWHRFTYLINWFWEKRLKLTRLWHMFNCVKLRSNKSIEMDSYLCGAGSFRSEVKIDCWRCWNLCRCLLFIDQLLFTRWYRRGHCSRVEAFWHKWSLKYWLIGLGRQKRASSLRLLLT